jgi:nucleoside-diphosphate-sugar epimerase
MDTCANIEKARRLLSWEPRIDLGTGIEKMI